MIRSKLAKPTASRARARGPSLNPSLVASSTLRRAYDVSPAPVALNEPCDLTCRRDAKAPLRPALGRLRYLIEAGLATKQGAAEGSRIVIDRIEGYAAPPGRPCRTTRLQAPEDRAKRLGAAAKGPRSRYDRLSARHQNRHSDWSRSRGRRDDGHPARRSRKRCFSSRYPSSRDRSTHRSRKRCPLRRTHRQGAVWRGGEPLRMVRKASDGPDRLYRGPDRTLVAQNTRCPSSRRKGSHSSRASAIEVGTTPTGTAAKG